MIFKEFTHQHFEEYCAWFEDKDLSRWLGPKPDKDWLTYVLADKTGKQYGIFQEGKMIAVLGIALPTEESPCLVITDIAVHPKLRGKGIGKAVIHHLLQLYPQASFKTFVDEKNINAISFFEHLEWKKMEVIDEDGMWVFFMRRRINHPKSM